MKKGFTLIELLVVMTVIAILTTMVLFGLNKSQQAARDASRQQIMTSLQNALERYYSDNQTYPNSAGIYWNGMLCALGGDSIGGCTGSQRYLNGPPVDPNKSCTAGFVPGNYWSPCASSAKPAYYYEPPGTAHAGYANSTCTGVFPQAYQLALINESGGIVYYCSPN